MKKFNRKECQFIQDRACERVHEIFDALGLEFEARQDYLQCACPVHSGDNPRGLYWAMQTSHWKCVTRQCEQNEATGPSSSIFGLVRGTLKNRNENNCTFQQAVNFVAKVLGITSIDMDCDTAEMIVINQTVREYRKRLASKVDNKGRLLSEILPSLQSDTIYYPQRGVSEDIISKYHISFCNDAHKPFFQRAFFPILDDTGRYILGWSARSIFDKCNECKLYHDPKQECPDNIGSQYAKWRHSSNFKAGHCLYNYWSAKTTIGKYGTAIVCEGPGDVWSLEQAGIKNGVALLGLNMSKIQRQLLQKAGALTLVFIFDNDDSGKQAIKKIKDNLMYYFRLFFITPENAKDLGDMVGKDIKEKILPIMEKLSMKRVLDDRYEMEDSKCQ